MGYPSLILSFSNQCNVIRSIICRNNNIFVVNIGQGNLTEIFPRFSMSMVLKYSVTLMLKDKIRLG
jgi:hypothetical protein